MLIAYCFLISTAKVQAFDLFRTPTPTLSLNHEINSTLHLLFRQQLSLEVSLLLMTILLEWCKSLLLERNLFLFELQNDFIFKELLADPTHKRSDGMPLVPSSASRLTLKE